MNFPTFHRLFCCAVVFLVLATVAASSPVIAQPAPAGDDDPAASLYERAQYNLSDEEYRNAAEEFRQVHVEYPESEYAGDALYWEAFARYRVGGTAELRAAMGALEYQKEQYLEAATRRDAAELATRIRGELARRGDAVAAAEVSRQAAELAESHAEIQSEMKAQAAEIAWETAALHKETASLAREEAALHRERMELDRFPEPAAIPDVAFPEMPLHPMWMSEEDETRMAALNALFQIDPERAFSIVEKILKRRDEESVRLRERALFLLAGTPYEKNEEILLDVIRNDPDPGVQEEAIFWLARVPSEKSFALFEELLDKSFDPGVQEAVVLALAHNPDERSDELLKNLASSDRSQKHIREAAIMGLAEKRSEGTYDFLITLFDDLPDDDLKENTMLVIAHDYGKESKDWLRGIALSDSKGGQSLELRKMALHLAGEEGYVTTSELVGMYDGLTEPDMREQVIYVLGHSDDPDAVDKLIEIARSEKDSELRRNVIFWIGNSGDDRAAKFLEELIDE